MAKNLWELFFARLKAGNPEWTRYTSRSNARWRKTATPFSQRIIVVLKHIHLFSSNVASTT